MLSDLFSYILIASLILTDVMYRMPMPIRAQAITLNLANTAITTSLYVSL